MQGSGRYWEFCTKHQVLVDMTKRDFNQGSQGMVGRFEQAGIVKTSTTISRRRMRCTKKNVMNNRKNGTGAPSGMSKDKTNGPTNIVVTEMIQDHISGESDAPIPALGVLQLVILRTPDAKESRSMRVYRAIALTSELASWHASVLVPMLERMSEPSEWRSAMHVVVNPESGLTNLL